jgi:hypothetical protein
MKEKPSDEFRAFDEAMGSILSVSYSDLQKRLKQEASAKSKVKSRRSTSKPSRAASRDKKKAA